VVWLVADLALILDWAEGAPVDRTGWAASADSLTKKADIPGRVVVNIVLG